MSQLGDSPEQLPHHWIISTNPSSIFSGQEGFFFASKYWERAYEAKKQKPAAQIITSS